jgi:hypothetical protein
MVAEWIGFADFSLDSLATLTADFQPVSQVSIGNDDTTTVTPLQA